MISNGNVIGVNALLETIQGPNMAYEMIIVEIADHICIIKLNRPKALNALNGLSREQARGEMCACRVPVEPRVSIPQHDARGVERGRDTERDARDG